MIGGFLRFFGWAQLVASLIGAIWAWTVMAMRTQGEQHTLWVVAGFAFVFWGLVLLCVLEALAQIVRNTRKAP